MNSRIHESKNNNLMKSSPASEGADALLTIYFTIPDSSELLNEIITVFFIK
jgi:hypothetical protein